MDVLLLHGPGESEYLVAVEGLLADVKFEVGGGRLAIVDNPANSLGTSEISASFVLLVVSAPEGFPIGVGVT